MMRPAAIVFDLDGTLVDSAPAIHAIAARYLAELDAPPLSLGEVRRFVGEGARVFLARALAARDLPAHEAAVAAAYPRFHAIYAAGPPEDNVLFEGARELIASLAGDGIPLGLCTNKPGAPTRAILEALGLAPHFAAVLTGDDPPLKPDPAPLLKAAARLGAAPDRILYVGDSEIDARTAAAAGTPFALHGGGYNDGRPPAGAAFSFASYTELAALLRGGGERAAVRAKTGDEPLPLEAE